MSQRFLGIEIVLVNTVDSLLFIDYQFSWPVDIWEPRISMSNVLQMLYRNV